eukprot:scaffold399825_cov34-Prasinocladus_malaysianus.AAC.1
MECIQQFIATSCKPLKDTKGTGPICKPNQGRALITTWQMISSRYVCPICLQLKADKTSEATK